MRYLIIALALLVGSFSASAQLGVSIGGPGFNIGINMPVYPRLVLIPGYPVYYDPDVRSNYFFYDGLYWVFVGDNWYASTWYNGPWELVLPEEVPQFLLLVPVRYYRAPPIYFRSWYRDGPPRWGEHWGRSWEQRRSGWDRWDRRSVPAPAPLPVYQRQYSGSRYPRAVEQQQTIQSQNYRYQPRDAVAQQHFRQRAGQGPAQGAPAPTRAQTQAPVQQRPRAPSDQRARIDRQQQRQQQQQTTQPTQTMRQGRQPQSATQAPQLQGPPQDRGRGDAGPPQARRAEPRLAPRENRPPAQAGGPQGRGPDSHPAPQARGAENRGGPQEGRGGGQGRGAREGRVKEDNKDKKDKKD